MSCLSFGPGEFREMQVQHEGAARCRNTLALRKGGLKYKLSAAGKPGMKLAVSTS
jgi:hypothetical protein